MSLPALTASELELITGVLSRHAEITMVKVFGSRAKGTHTPRSDVDLAIWGDVDSLSAERVAAELDELPLPYRFEVQPFDQIKLPTLRDHIERVGISIYSSADHPCA